MTRAPPGLTRQESDFPGLETACPVPDPGTNAAEAATAECLVKFRLFMFPIVSCQLIEVMVVVTLHFFIFVCRINSMAFSAKRRPRIG